MRIYAWLASALVLCCQPASAIDDTPAQFTLRDGEVRVGAHVRRDAAAAAPAYRRGAGNSPEERRALRLAYDSLAADDEPPFPANGMAAIQRAIREAQGRLPEAGMLRMVVRVDSKGDASAVEILSSPGEKTTRFAATLLMAAKYKPGLCRGVPCNMEFPFSAAFPGSPKTLLN
ncbi:hypothetical protein [Janthinobacterium fluminis]|uniref:TonB C-terminal domain-containing protein n=1 Tax=Janthinobacterium fluminis TaxID=2987524 RepID=A0ABT5JVE2_9BURK|nr:hypothetical protein [Janthinobacterium fluminis]MDC8756539.1 hypothetical protein [Janthinobacterium fluminis]